MIRKQIYIGQDQNVLLKKKARDLNATEAEIVRQALEKYLIAGRGVRHKTTAWEEEKKFIQSRMELGRGRQGEARRWRRGELYDRKDVG